MDLSKFVTNYFYRIKLNKVKIKYRMIKLNFNQKMKDNL